jgi:hypothetical protein
MQVHTAPLKSLLYARKKSNFSRFLRNLSLYVICITPGREADYSPPSSPEVKNAWSYTSTPSYAFMAWYMIMYMDDLTLPVSSILRIFVVLWLSELFLCMDGDSRIGLIATIPLKLYVDVIQGLLPVVRDAI